MSTSAPMNDAGGSKRDDDPNEALSKCIFAQYAMTFAAVSTGTAYAVWKRPPNGMAVMLVAGAGGSLLDLLYGWNVACVAQVHDWRQHQAALANAATEQEKQNKPQP